MRALPFRWHPRNGPIVDGVGPIPGLAGGHLPTADADHLAPQQDHCTCNDNLKGLIKI
jgi:hypothetical protein